MLDFADDQLAGALRMAYNIINTPATPLPHKGDAHFGQVFFFA